MYSKVENQILPSPTPYSLFSKLSNSKCRLLSLCRLFLSLSVCLSLSLSPSPLAPQVIPVYERGSRFQPTTVEMTDGETSPPQLLTEADLISLMEKHGIG